LNFLENSCFFTIDRPWDKSTRAVVYELPDVISPAGLSKINETIHHIIHEIVLSCLEIKSRQLSGIDSHSPQVFEPKVIENYF